VPLEAARLGEQQHARLGRGLHDVDQVVAPDLEIVARHRPWLEGAAEQVGGGGDVRVAADQVGGVFRGLRAEVGGEDAPARVGLVVCY
jgi:hypothetical protein